MNRSCVGGLALGLLLVAGSGATAQAGAGDDLGSPAGTEDMTSDDGPVGIQPSTTPSRFACAVSGRSHTSGLVEMLGLGALLLVRRSRKRACAHD